MTLPSLLLAQEPIQRVERDRLAEAMREEQRAGYDLTLTAFAARLQAGVLMRVVRAAQAADSNGPPLYIHHADYFNAFLDVTGLQPARAPRYMRVSCEYGENLVVEFRRDSVVRRLGTAESPVLALTVIGGWRDHAAERYAYDDTTSSPRVRVIHQRLNSYRILYYDSMTVYDDITGVGGRATSGVLGALFKVIGYGWASYTRTALAGDGYQVMRARVHKGPIRLSQTVTIRPDGRVDKGVPRDRTDLRDLETWLNRRIDIDYHPARQDGIPVSVAPARGETDCGRAPPIEAPGRAAPLRSMHARMGVMHAPTVRAP